MLAKGGLVVEALLLRLRVGADVGTKEIVLAMCEGTRLAAVTVPIFREKGAQYRFISKSLL